MSGKTASWDARPEITSYFLWRKPRSPPLDKCRYSLWGLCAASCEAALLSCGSRASVGSRSTPPPAPYLAVTKAPSQAQGRQQEQGTRQSMDKENREGDRSAPEPPNRPHTRRNVLDRSIRYIGWKFRGQYDHIVFKLTSRWHAQLPSVAPRCALPPARWQAARGAVVAPGVSGSGKSRPSRGWRAPSCSIYRVCTSRENSQRGQLTKDPRGR
jgi:hypothetical protein